MRSELKKCERGSKIVEASSLLLYFFGTILFLIYYACTSSYLLILYALKLLSDFMAVFSYFFFDSKDSSSSGDSKDSSSSGDSNDSSSSFKNPRFYVKLGKFLSAIFLLFVSILLLINNDHKFLEW